MVEPPKPHVVDGRVLNVDDAHSTKEQVEKEVAEPTKRGRQVESGDGALDPPGVADSHTFPENTHAHHPSSGAVGTIVNESNSHID